MNAINICILRNFSKAKAKCTKTPFFDVKLAREFNKCKGSDQGQNTLTAEKYLSSTRYLNGERGNPAMD